MKPAPQQKSGESFIWYGYRKWRWLADHVVEVHARSQATTYLHRMAVKEGRARFNEIKFVRKGRAA